MVKHRSRPVSTASLVSFKPHVELSAESTKSELGGQHKAGFAAIKLQHTRPRCPLVTWRQLKITRSKPETQRAFNLVSDKAYWNRTAQSESGRVQSAKADQ